MHRDPRDTAPHIETLIEATTPTSGGAYGIFDSRNDMEHVASAASGYSHNSDGEVIFRRLRRGAPVLVQPRPNAAASHGHSTSDDSSEVPDVPADTQPGGRTYLLARAVSSAHANSGFPDRQSSASSLPWPPAAQVPAEASNIDEIIRGIYDIINTPPRTAASLLETSYGAEFGEEIEGLQGLGIFDSGPPPSTSNLAPQEVGHWSLPTAMEVPHDIFTLSRNAPQTVDTGIAALPPHPTEDLRLTGANYIVGTTPYYLSTAAPPMVNMDHFSAYRGNSSPNPSAFNFSALQQPAVRAPLMSEDWPVWIDVAFAIQRKNILATVDSENLPEGARRTHQQLAQAIWHSGNHIAIDAMNEAGDKQGIILVPWHTLEAVLEDFGIQGVA
ncbi:hypothetical protein FPV67DRAFT_1676762 [Lyophyllum atratum]|nr:hypothetical protein FPV67DRAFT_1676762 [Lyophyllum atratum]